MSGRMMLLRPTRWSRPLDWLPALSAYIAVVPQTSDLKLYLDARSPDVAPTTVRRILERACDYLSIGDQFASIVLLEGMAEPPVVAVSVTDAAEMLDCVALDVPRLEQRATAVVSHALWVKALVDAIQADLDQAAYVAAPPVPADGLPLVTVRIPTYGGGHALVERAIPSALASPYPHVEVLVCSDGPQPHARAAVEALGDPRVRYLELEERPAYPSSPEAFWRSAGSFAANRLLDEARGLFTTPLDHDDAYTFSHIPLLLDALRRGGLDFVYGQAMTEFPQGAWSLHGSAPLASGQLNQASVMYSARLSHMRYDPHAWLLGEPGDWNLWRRFRDVGAAIGHVSQPVAVHFKERSSIDHIEPAQQDHPPEVIASDILGTSARELLTVASRDAGAL